MPNRATPLGSTLDGRPFCGHSMLHFGLNYEPLFVHHNSLKSFAQVTSGIGFDLKSVTAPEREEYVTLDNNNITLNGTSVVITCWTHTAIFTHDANTNVIRIVDSGLSEFGIELREAFNFIEMKLKPI